MIGKITSGRGARGLLNYVTEKDRAEYIGGSMTGRTAQELSAELSHTRGMKPDAAKPVKHFSLSLPKGEIFSHRDWNRFAESYMEKMGYGKAQWVAFRHNDTKQDHIHIVASRIGIDGRLIRDSHERSKNQTTLRGLETELSLSSPKRTCLKNEQNNGKYQTEKRTGNTHQKEMINKIEHAVSKSKDFKEFRMTLFVEKTKVNPILDKQGQVKDVFFDGQNWKTSGKKIEWTLDKLEANGLKIDRKDLAKDPDAWRPGDKTNREATPGRESNSQYFKEGKAIERQYTHQVSALKSKAEPYFVRQKELKNYTDSLFKDLKRCQDAIKNLYEERGKALAEASKKDQPSMRSWSRIEKAKSWHRVESMGSWHRVQGMASWHRIDLTKSHREQVREKYDAALKPIQEARKFVRGQIDAAKPEQAMIREYLSQYRQDGARLQGAFQVQRLDLAERKYKGEVESVNHRFNGREGTPEHRAALRGCDERAARSFSYEASRAEKTLGKKKDLFVDVHSQRIARIEGGKAFLKESGRALTEGFSRVAEKAKETGRAAREALGTRSPEAWKAFGDRVQDLGRQVRTELHAIRDRATEAAKPYREAERFSSEASRSEAIRSRWDRVSQEVQRDRTPHDRAAKEPPREPPGKAPEKASPEAIRQSAEPTKAPQREATQPLAKIPEMAKERAEALRPVLEQAAKGCKTFQEFAQRLEAQGVRVVRNQGGNGFAYVQDGERIKASAVGHGKTELERKGMDCESIRYGSEGRRGVEPEKDRGSADSRTPSHDHALEGRGATGRRETTGDREPSPRETAAPEQGTRPQGDGDRRGEGRDAGRAEVPGTKAESLDPGVREVRASEPERGTPARDGDGPGREPGRAQEVPGGGPSGGRETGGAREDLRADGLAPHRGPDGGVLSVSPQLDQVAGGSGVGTGRGSGEGAAWAREIEALGNSIITRSEGVPGRESSQAPEPSAGRIREEARTDGAGPSGPQTERAAQPSREAEAHATQFLAQQDAKIQGISSELQQLKTDWQSRVKEGGTSFQEIAGYSQRTINLESSLYQGQSRRDECVYMQRTGRVEVWSTANKMEGKAAELRIEAKELKAEVGRERQDPNRGDRNRADSLDKASAGKVKEAYGLERQAFAMKHGEPQRGFQQLGAAEWKAQCFSGKADQWKADGLIQSNPFRQSGSLSPQSMFEAIRKLEKLGAQGMDPATAPKDLVKEVMQVCAQLARSLQRGLDLG